MTPTVPSGDSDLDEQVAYSDDGREFRRAVHCRRRREIPRKERVSDWWTVQAADMGDGTFRRVGPNNPDEEEIINKHIFLPYLPYFSNCAGYDSHMSIARLLETHPTCQGITELDGATAPSRFKEIKPVQEWGIVTFPRADTPSADKCYGGGQGNKFGAYVECEFEESVLLTESMTRWFEADAGTVLFQMTSQGFAPDDTEARLDGVKGVSEGGRLIKDQTHREQDYELYTVDFVPPSFYDPSMKFNQAAKKNLRTLAVRTQQRRYATRRLHGQRQSPCRNRRGQTRCRGLHPEAGEAQDRILPEGRETQTHRPGHCQNVRAVHDHPASTIRGGSIESTGFFGKERHSHFPLCRDLERRARESEVSARRAIRCFGLVRPAQHVQVRTLGIHGLLHHRRRHHCPRGCVGLGHQPHADESASPAALQRFDALLDHLVGAGDRRRPRYRSDGHPLVHHQELALSVQGQWHVGLQGVSSIFR